MCGSRVKTTRRESVEPGPELSAADPDVLPLANSGELTAPDRVVHVARREPRFCRDVGDREELITGGAVRLSRDRCRSAEHVGPQCRADLLERSEQSGDVVGPEIGYATGIRDDQAEVRKSAEVH